MTQETTQNVPVVNGQSHDMAIAAENMEEISEFMMVSAIATSSLKTVESLGNNMRDIADIMGNTMVEIKRMDTALGMLMMNLSNDLEKFKMAVPVVEKQLDQVSSRIDRITDRIMDCDDVSSEGLQRQQMLLDTLQQASDSFNNMLMRLMAR